MKPQSSACDWTQRTALLLGGLLLVGLPFAVTGAAGTGANGNGGDRPSDETGDDPQDDGGFSDDETVGTLPFTSPDWPSTEGIQDFTTEQLQFSVRGTAEELWTHLINAWGDGHVVQTVHENGEIEWTFHGDVTVLLDEGVALSGEIQAEVEYGMAFRGAPAVVFAEAWQSDVFSLPAGGLELPLERMDRGGLFDAGPVEVHALSHFGERSYLRMETWGGMLRIDQRH